MFLQCSAFDHLTQIPKNICDVLYLVRIITTFFKYWPVAFTFKYPQLQGHQFPLKALNEDSSYKVLQCNFSLSASENPESPYFGYLNFRICTVLNIQQNGKNQSKYAGFIKKCASVTFNKTSMLVRFYFDVSYFINLFLKSGNSYLVFHNSLNVYKLFVQVFISLVHCKNKSSQLLNFF